MKSNEPPQYKIYHSVFHVKRLPLNANTLGIVNTDIIKNIIIETQDNVKLYLSESEAKQLAKELDKAASEKT